MFGVTTLFISVSSRIEAFIKMLALQGILLFAIIAVDFQKIDLFDFSLLTIETVAVKTILIPIFLIRIMRKNEIFRVVEPYISNFYSLLISTLIFAFGFLIAYLSMDFAKGIKPLHFGTSISAILVGLFIFMTRKKIFTHVLGYVVIENGIFLLSLSIAEKMPLIVDLGILLDLFMLIFILGMFVNKIQTAYDETDIDKLTSLKD